MALPVDHDIAVMTVLNLEYVACHGIRCHRLDEVEPCFLISDGVFSAVFCNEEALEVVNLRAAHFVSRGRIRDNVDDTALLSVSSAYVTWAHQTYTRCGCCHTVRIKIERQTHAGEDVFEHGNELKGKHILPTIITNFEDRLNPYVLLGATHFVSTVARY